MNIKGYFISYEYDVEFSNIIATNHKNSISIPFQLRINSYVKLTKDNINQFCKLDLYKNVDLPNWFNINTAKEKAINAYIKKYKNILEI